MELLVKEEFPTLNDDNIKALPCHKCIVNKVRTEKNIDFPQFCAAMGFTLPQTYFSKMPVRRVNSLN